MSIKQTKTVLLGIIVLLTFLVFFQACEKSDSKSLIGTLTLPTGVTKTVTHKGKRVSITASDFKESRCPFNADCTWIGNATVKITFKDETKEEVINMCLGGCDLLSVPLPNSITLNGTTYKIKLQSITPDPSIGKVNQEPSTAKITLSE